MEQCCAADEIPIGAGIQLLDGMDMLLATHEATRFGWRVNERRRLDELPHQIRRPARAVRVCIGHDSPDPGDIHPTGGDGALGPEGVTVDTD
jgi:hypothetical protein